MSETGIIQQVQNTAVAMPTAGAVNVWSDKAAFDQLTQVANMLSRSTVVPQAYQGKPEDCFIAAELASRMNTSPLFIMQNLFVVKGKPTWAGQACMAMIQACGKFKNVKHVYTGERGKDNRGCYVEAVRISDGEVLQGTEITIQMAKDEGWLSNSKWRTMPEQMLGYRAASFFARMFCPEAMMGLQTSEEVYDTTTPSVETPTVSAQELGQNILNEEKTPPAKEKKEKGPAEEKKPDEQKLICADCGGEITGTKKFTRQQVAEASKAKYGRCLCLKCGAAAKKKAEEEEYQKAMEGATEDDQDDLASQLLNGSNN